MARRVPLSVELLKHRSAVTSGARILAGIDQRFAPARRYKDVCDSIASDLGGADHLTASQMQLVRSAAGLVVLRERIDADVLNGESIDIDEYCKITNALRRILATIGLKRVAKDVTPDLNDYLAQRGQHRTRRNGNGRGRIIDHEEDG